MALGSCTSAAYSPAVEKARALDAAGEATTLNAELLALNRTSQGVLLQALTSLVVLLVLLDMIFKPGA